jgi:hypothetical protein
MDHTRVKKEMKKKIKKKSIVKSKNELVIEIIDSNELLSHRLYAMYSPIIIDVTLDLDNLFLLSFLLQNLAC